LQGFTHAVASVTMGMAIYALCSERGKRSVRRDPLARARGLPQWAARDKCRFGQIVTGKEVAEGAEAVAMCLTGKAGRE
jgi:hypothetical protein